MSPEHDRRWTLTGSAFEALLRRLGDDPEAAGREYDLARRKLVGFFDRRQVPQPEALADEVLDRVARRLEEGEAVDHLSAYLYGVARHVMLEWARRQAAERVAREQLRLRPAGPDPHAAEDHLQCLERCLAAFPPGAQELITGYYRGRLDERKRLAERLAMSYTALKSQAHRIRMRLGACVRECLARAGRRDQ